MKKLSQILATLCCFGAWLPFEEASGAVTYVSLISPSWPQGEPPGHFPGTTDIDFDMDGTVDVAFSAGQSYGFKAIPSFYTEIYAIDKPPPDVGAFSIPLDFGAIIGPTVIAPSAWVYDPAGATIHNSNSIGTLGLWPFGIHYLGARFDIAGDWHYGWVEVDSWTGVNTGFIRGYAYETQPGVPIFAGSVPEPGRTTLLMLAFIGWCLRRRGGGFL